MMGGGAGGAVRPDGGRPLRRPDLFPTARAQEGKRQRLFRLIGELVKWESTAREPVSPAARDEIWRWRRACAVNAGHPRAGELLDPQRLPNGLVQSWPEIARLAPQSATAGSGDLLD